MKDERGGEGRERGVERERERERESRVQRGRERKRRRKVVVVVFILLSSLETKRHELDFDVDDVNEKAQ